MKKVLSVFLCIMVIMFSSLPALSVYASDNDLAQTSATAISDGNTVYVSDLTPTSSTNGWGPIEKDMSVGEQSSGDGTVITLEGVTYNKGIGTNSVSEIVYDIEGKYDTFISDVGIDDGVGTNGSAVFEVWGDGTKLWESSVMQGSTPTATASISVKGVKSLKLVVNDGGDSNAYDHGDWAGAKLIASQVSENVKPFKLTSNGTIDTSSGIKASVSVLPVEGVTTHSGDEVVAFQLLKGNAPVSIVAIIKDILSQEDFTAYFNVDAKTDTSYKVKAYVFDSLDANITQAPIALANIETLSIKDQPNLNIPWNWTGVLGTGQSLSVGANPILSTTQPYNNLKLSLGNLTVPPFDPNSSELKMVPLIEPIRSLATSYPGPYPKNIWGETPHSSMANQITAMAKAAGAPDYITAHSVVGESGQGISVIRKGATDTGTTGRAYAASLFEISAINRLAKAAGKTYGVGGITLIHGETDCGSQTYESDVRKLWSDYNDDIKTITGQTQNIPMFVLQQHSYPSTGTSAATLAQWKAGVDYKGDIVCIGPNYQRYYGSDHVHLISSGYQQLGEKFGQVYYERVILGNDWQPLQPISAAKSGKVITVNFHVPVGPLVWDTTLPEPNQSSQTEWKNGKGFEVTANGSRVTIDSVEISGDSVKITCNSDLPATGVNIAYAFTGGTYRSNGTYRWGLLRDSDPFKGSVTGVEQPNFCVAFRMAVQ